jgi:hypothetical protein
MPKTTPEQITPEQIAAWKKEHENVFKVQVEGKTAYLRSPDRKEMSYAAQVGKTDAMKFNEYLMKTCWLAGDEEIQTKDSLFMSVAGKLVAIIDIKESTLEKL